MLDYSHKHFSLLQDIRNQFALDWEGVHGFRHWSNVQKYSLHLINIRGGDMEIVELFAWLHDSKRLNDYSDPDHGARAAAYAEILNGKHFDLSPSRLSILQYAIDDHSKGFLSDDATIQSCWDGDRLDLERVGVEPNPKRLSAYAIPLINIRI